MTLHQRTLRAARSSAPTAQGGKAAGQAFRRHKSDDNHGGGDAAASSAGVTPSRVSDEPGTDNTATDLVCRFASPLLDYLSGFLAPRDEYRRVKAALLYDGYVAAASWMLAAVLVNHIRRVLAPWLGQFLWWHPVEAMKMARSSPHYFLQQQLVRDYRTLGLWLLQMAALSLGKRAARRSWTAGRHRQRGAAAVAVDVCRILHLALCLAELEAAYAESCWAGAWAYATVYIWRRGSPAQRRFAKKLLWDDAAPSSERTMALAVVGLLLLCSAWRVARLLRVQPARRGVLGVAASALAVFWGLLAAGTAYVVRYSNRYFIWLEMTDMLLTWLWMGLAVCVVAWWRWFGPEERANKLA